MTGLWHITPLPAVGYWHRLTRGEMQDCHRTSHIEKTVGTVSGHVPPACG
jgi:hypothetical protein